VLIVDEAHGLPTALLEEIRLLMNFETNSEKMLQVILSGQPELHDLLNRPALRQLKQRVSLRSQVKPLSVFEINKYIRFRLKQAGRNQCKPVRKWSDRIDRQRFARYSADR
jgi:type II secretory pathway predicted ATPase ExeA